MDSQASQGMSAQTTIPRIPVPGFFAAVSAGSTPVSLPDLPPDWNHIIGLDHGTIAAREDVIIGEADRILVAARGAFHWEGSSFAPIAAARGDGAALAAAYEALGAGFVAELRGHFAVTVVDLERRALIAATDRFASIPVFCRVDSDEARAALGPDVLSRGESPAALSRQALFHYCYFHTIPAPDSVFDGITTLPAAHCLEWRGGETRIAPYWVPDFSRRSRSTGDGDYSKLRGVLGAAVNRCLGNSRQPGAFLSGGLDSSTVVGLMAETNRSGRAYSIGFDAEGYDEMPYARLTARHFDVPLEEYYLTPEDIVDALPDLAAGAPEPFGNSSLLPAYYCARLAARDGVDLMLAGDGGDELFAGNERYLRQRVFNHYRALPGGLRRQVVDPIVDHLPKRLPFAAKLASYVRQARVPLPDRLQSYNFLHRFDLEEMFDPGFLSGIDREQPLARLRETYHRPASGSELDRMLYHDWQITLADNDLRKVGHACLRAGVPVAYPMLDDALVDFACQLDDRLLLDGGELRAYYKRALKGWLPEATLRKTKHGFGLPFGVWMREHRPLQEMVYDSIASLGQRSLLRPAFLDECVRLHREGHASYYGELLWILTCLEFWLGARE